MKRAISLCLFACVLVAGWLSLSAVVICGQSPDRGRKGSGIQPQDRKNKGSRIQALVNHNKPPRLVTRQAGHPMRVPLFPKDYDWKEDERIHNALHDLYQDSSVDLWEELIQKAQDARYCETSWDAGEEARIHSVGDVCRNLAYLRLTDVYASHLPSLPPHGCPIHFEKIRSNLPAWRKERGGKALYQLQIEVAEMAIGKLSGTDALPLSAQEKATARKGIEADVMKLKRTKEAIFRDHPGYGTRYTPGLAKRIRKAVDTGSGEDIDLEK